MVTQNGGFDNAKPPLCLRLGVWHNASVRYLLYSHAMGSGQNLSDLSMTLILKMPKDSLWHGSC